MRDDSLGREESEDAERELRRLVRLLGAKAKQVAALSAAGIT